MATPSTSLDRIRHVQYMPDVDFLAPHGGELVVLDR